jgi:hypothetical protein
MSYRSQRGNSGYESEAPDLTEEDGYTDEEKDEKPDEIPWDIYEETVEEEVRDQLEETLDDRPFLENETSIPNIASDEAKRILNNRDDIRSKEEIKEIVNEHLRVEFSLEKDTTTQLNEFRNQILNANSRLIKGESVAIIILGVGALLVNGGLWQISSGVFSFGYRVMVLILTTSFSLSLIVAGIYGLRKNV